MQDGVIASLDQVSKTWLTSVLKRSGALRHGSVASVELGQGEGNWSRNATLGLTYTDDASGRRPGRLFLKMVETDLGDDEYFGDSEVTYYTRDYVDVRDAPLLRCYDAVYSKEQQRYHLLLQDVSSTHVEAADREPTLEYGLALAEGLAALHARWWGGQRLAEAGLSIHGASHIQRFVDIAAPGVAHITQSMAGELQPHWPQVLHELYAQHPRAMVARTRDANGFTLIHGDVGSRNVLVPRAGSRPIYIIDRQPFDWSLTVWLGVYDLAYAIVLDWPTELRRRWEDAILQRYHESLIDHGVLDYSRDQLMHDYRLCVPMGVYIATEYCRGGLNAQWAHVWLPMLQRALTACDDLACQELWQAPESG